MAESAQPVLQQKARWPLGAVSPTQKRVMYGSVIAIAAALLLFTGNGTQKAAVTPKPTADPKTAEPVLPVQVKEFQDSMQQEANRIEQGRKQMEAAQQAANEGLMQNPLPVASLNNQQMPAYGPSQSFAAGTGTRPAAASGPRHSSLLASNIVQANDGDRQGALASVPPDPPQIAPLPAWSGIPYPSAPSTPKAQSRAKDQGKDENADKPADPLRFNPAWSTVWLPEGFVMETALVNELQGSAVGPVECMVTTNVYAPGSRLLLIPQGSRIVGDASAVNAFGQSRLAVKFSRVLVQGDRLYSIPLERDIPGLDQQGGVGLRDKVNSHYFSIFGASLAIGAVGGLANIGNSVSGYGYNAMSQFRSGIAESTSQSSMQVLDRFLNRMPTITIRPGTRVKITLTGDVQVPIYHTGDTGSE